MAVKNNIAQAAENKKCIAKANFRLAYALHTYENIKSSYEKKVILQTLLDARHYLDKVIKDLKIDTFLDDLDT